MSAIEIEFFPQSSRSAKERLDGLQRASSVDMTADYHQFGYDYFDNPNLSVGYNGYSYDGRYAEAVDRICQHYGLGPGSRVLEIGCAKGYVLVEFHKRGIEVAGLDASEYAIENAHPDIRPFVTYGDVVDLPYSDNAFDLVLGKEVLPHIPEERLPEAISECMRVSRGGIFFEVQCGESEIELEYMQRWDGTHKAVRTRQWWDALFDRLGYTGDVHYKVLVPEVTNE